MLGGWLALLAAATFALSNVSSRRGVIGATVFQGLAITVPIGVPLFIAAALAAGGAEALFGFSVGQVLSLATAGIFHFVLARYCAYRSLRALGSNLAAPVQRLSLLVSLALAIWLLDEFLTPLRLLGIALVIAGPVVMLSGQVTAGQRSKARAAAPVFQPQYLEGYVFGILSAAGYGLSPLFIRATLHGADPGTAVAGGVFSYAAAAIVLAPAFLHVSTRRTILAIRGGPAGWFVVAGVLTAVSQMIRYIALALAPVTVVSSIMVSSLVFRFLFSRLINRDYEIFGVWVLVGIVITIVGSLALTLETDAVLSVIPLPEALRDVVHWRWPTR